jgi:pimeloyl-ACP methyl ester carboxylesterase
MLNEHSFDTGTVALHYVEGPPAATPLVLLHGVTGRWQSFLPVIPLLSVRWHTYALDLRGHGRSGHAPPAYRFVDYSRDVCAFLYNHLQRPAILLGHSLGAMVALHCAAEAPDLVQAVVLEEPPLYAAGTRLEETPWHRYLVAYQKLARPGHTLGEVLAALADLRPDMDAVDRRARAKTVLQTDPEVVTPILAVQEREGYDTDALLTQLRCPVLLVLGDPALGGVVNEAEAARASALPADCTVVRMPEVGHVIHGYQPVSYYGVVSAFLESL